MAESVLFTCVGTTDTVRGLRDGGMMHAVRHYRPQKVYIFVSSEMEMLNQRDRRYEKTFRFIQEKWGGYAPEVRYNLSGIVDAAWTRWPSPGAISWSGLFVKTRRRRFSSI